MKGKSEKQIKEYVAKKKTEREKIQAEIKSINAKRDAYIAKQQNAEKGELENALVTAIKKQGARKNYTWDKK